MLVDLTVKEFLNKVAGSDPVPGGGSIAALNGAVASALAAMVANLTIGKKNYEEHEELMNHIDSHIKNPSIGLSAGLMDFCRGYSPIIIL